MKINRLIVNILKIRTQKHKRHSQELEQSQRTENDVGFDRMTCKGVNNERQDGG